MAYCRSNAAHRLPTGTNATVRVPLLVSSPSDRADATSEESRGRSIWISSRSGAKAVAICSPHPHKHHRVLAGVFKFFVQSQRFQLVQQTPDGVLPRRDRPRAAQTVGIHMHQMSRSAVGEMPVKFAGNGECRKHDGFGNVQPRAEALAMVLPAPRGPESSNTSPPCTIPATRRPSSCMASLVGAAIVCSLINTPLSTFTDLYD